MKKFIANRYFEYHGTSYEEGDTVEVEDHVADKLCKRGYGSMRIGDERRVEEAPVVESKRKKSRRKKKNKE